MAAVLAPRAHRWLWAAQRRGLRYSHYQCADIRPLALSAHTDNSDGEVPRERPEPLSAQDLSMGDQAFVALFARYQLPLLDYLYGMMRDRETAADLVQETFLKAYTSCDAVAQIAHPQAWLYRIATNSALNALRRRRRFLWIPLSDLDSELLANSAEPPALPALPALPPVLSCADIAATVAERELIWQVLAELPGRWRAVLLLQTTAGFTVAEIAQLLSLTPANTRKILYRAKERFRELHARLDATDGPEAQSDSKTGGC